MNDQFPPNPPQTQQNPTIQQDIGVVLRVMGLSTAIALGIKYIMPTVPIPASTPIALFLIALPSAIVALILKLK